MANAMAKTCPVPVPVPRTLRVRRWIVSYWRGTEATYLVPRHSSYTANVRLPWQLLGNPGLLQILRCGPCSLRWRLYNGLGLDVSDLASQLGYMPQAAIDAGRRWTAEEIAKVPPRKIGTKR